MTIANSLSVSGPATGRVGHKIKLAGQLSPAMSGAVALQLKAHGWQTIAHKATKADGSYKFAVKATHAGLYKFRVLYGGGNGYLGSKSGKVKVRVH